MSRRAVVTGASGFLGRRLCAALTASGWRVTGVARGPGPLSAACADWLRRDLTAEGLRPAELEGVDVVFHLAGANGGAGLDESGYLMANERAALNVFDSCCGCVPRLVHASSQVVYGDPGRLDVKETDPLAPDTPYALSKANAETWLAKVAARAKLAATALRLTGFVGGGGAVDHIVDCARSGRPIELFAQGRVRRDYLAIADGVAAFLAAAQAPAKPGLTAYNVGSGTAPSAADLARLVCVELGSTSEIKLLDRPAPRGDFALDIAKARAELGFAPRSVEQALRDYLKLPEAARA